MVAGRVLCYLKAQLSPYLSSRALQDGGRRLNCVYSSFISQSL